MQGYKAIFTNNNKIYRAQERRDYRLHLLRHRKQHSRITFQNLPHQTQKSPSPLHRNRQRRTQHCLPRPHRTVPNVIHPREWIYTHRLPLRLQLHHSAPSKKTNGASPNYNMEKPTSYICQSRNCTQSMGHGQRNLVRTKDCIWTQQCIVSAGSTKLTPQKPRWTRHPDLQKSLQVRVSYYGPKSSPLRMVLVNTTS